METLLLGIKYIKSLSTLWSFNNVHIFSDRTAARNAIISPTKQDLHHNIIEEIKYISDSIEPITIIATYLPAHCGIVHNEEADRLVKIGAKYAKKLKKIYTWLLKNLKSDNFTCTLRLISHQLD